MSPMETLIDFQLTLADQCRQLGLFHEPIRVVGCVQVGTQVREDGAIVLHDSLPS